MSRERVVWIDVVKCLAIVMVVLAHILWVTDSAPSQIVSIEEGFLTANRIFASMGVPLFMMVSGVLLLDKKFDTIADIKNFYKRGLLPLFLTAEIWIVVYSIVNVSPFSLKELLLNMTFIHKPEVHLWYVRLIVAYYFLLPLLVGMRKRNWLLAFFLVVVFVMTFAYNGWLIYEGDDCPTSSSRSYFCYVIYMVIGYTLAKIRMTKLRTVIAAFVSLVGGVFSVCDINAKRLFLVV